MPSVTAVWRQNGHFGRFSDLSLSVVGRFCSEFDMGPHLSHIYMCQTDKYEYCRARHENTVINGSLAPFWRQNGHSGRFSDLSLSIVGQFCSEFEMGPHLGHIYMCQTDKYKYCRARHENAVINGSLAPFWRQNGHYGRFSDLSRSVEGRFCSEFDRRPHLGNVYMCQTDKYNYCRHIHEEAVINWKVAPFWRKNCHSGHFSDLYLSVVGRV